MAFSSIGFFNTLTHQDLLNTVSTALGGKRSAARSPESILLGRIKKDLEHYEQQLRLFLADPAGVVLDNLEQRRYALFDKIVDRIDDNLNFWILDDTDILDQIGLTEETAYDEVPSYISSWQLLQPSPDGDDRRIFPSESNADGHFWDNEEMTALVSRLIDPGHIELCKDAGIVEMVAQLRALEGEYEKIPVSRELSERIGAIRDLRYHLCAGISLSKSLYKNKDPYKDSKDIKAIELFADRFKAVYEQQKLEMFSVDELAPDDFLTMMERFETESAGTNEFIKHTKKNFVEALKEYRLTLELFRQHERWPDFKDLETDLYRLSIGLISKVSGFLACFDIDDEEYVKQHYESPHYQAARKLLKELEITPYHSFVLWEPDHTVEFRILEVMFEVWNEPEFRKDLQTLDATDLFDKCLHLDRATGLIAETIAGEDSEEILQTLRDSRSKLSLFFQVIRGEENSKL
jgi:hypothetical protein